MLTYFITAYPHLSVFYALFFVVTGYLAPRMVRDARRVPRHHAFRTPMPVGWENTLRMV